MLPAVCEAYYYLPAALSIVVLACLLGCAVLALWCFFCEMRATA